MNTNDAELYGKIYFESDRTFEELESMLQLFLNSEFTPDEDYEFSEYTIECYFLKIVISFLFYDEDVSIKYCMNLISRNKINFENTNLPEKIQMEDYLHTLLRKCGVAKFNTNLYGSKHPVKSENFSIFFDYIFNSKMDSYKLKETFEALFHVSLEVSPDKSLLFTDVFGIKLNIELLESRIDNHFSYRIYSSYLSNEDEMYSKIDLTSYIYTLLKYEEILVE